MVYHSNRACEELTIATVCEDFIIATEPHTVVVKPFIYSMVYHTNRACEEVTIATVCEDFKVATELCEDNTMATHLTISTEHTHSIIASNCGFSSPFYNSNKHVKI